MNKQTTRGYEVNMRRDTRTGENLAVIPNTYNQGCGRYYMALTETGDWVRLSPAYVTGNTKTVTDYPETLKRAIDRQQGYLLITVPRVYG